MRELESGVASECVRERTARPTPASRSHLLDPDVTPDGSAVAFCFGRGHMATGLAVLRLGRPSDPDGLPRAIGGPEYVARSKVTWHVHNGGWSPDSKSLVYTRDINYGARATSSIHRHRQELAVSYRGIVMRGRCMSRNSWILFVLALLLHRWVSWPRKERPFVPAIWVYRLKADPAHTMRSPMSSESRSGTSR